MKDLIGLSDYRRQTYQWLIDEKIKGKKILDAGSGRWKIEDYIPLEYETIERLDFNPLAIPKPDITADICDNGWALQRKEKYDVVLCLSVLEHTLSPNRVLQNLHEVLKTGGILYVSAPFVYGVHDDFDYFRFTEQYFEKYLTMLGFRNVFVDSYKAGSCIPGFPGYGVRAKGVK